MFSCTIPTYHSIDYISHTNIYKYIYCDILYFFMKPIKHLQIKTLQAMYFEFKKQRFTNPTGSDVVPKKEETAEATEGT